MLTKFIEETQVILYCTETCRRKVATFDLPDVVTRPV